MAKYRRSKKTLEEKVFDLDREFAKEMRAGTADFIKEKLIKMDKYENELQEAKKEDSDLASKREALKIANQTYAEPLNAIKLKRSLALKILSEKGQ